MEQRFVNSQCFICEAKSRPQLVQKTSGFKKRRDDGLAVIDQVDEPKMDKVRKTLWRRSNLREFPLPYRMRDKNFTETGFLDFSFNQEINNFFPYRKTNNTPLYIHSDSNHPPYLIKQLTSMTNRCISNISCNENEFNKAKTLYKSVKQ